VKEALIDALTVIRHSVIVLPGGQRRWAVLCRGPVAQPGQSHPRDQPL